MLLFLESIRLDLALATGECCTTWPVVCGGRRHRLPIKAGLLQTHPHRLEGKQYACDCSQQATDAVYRQGQIQWHAKHHLQNKRRRAEKPGGATYSLIWRSAMLYWCWKFCGMPKKTLVHTVPVIQREWSVNQFYSSQCKYPVPRLGFVSGTPDGWKERAFHSGQMLSKTNV